MSDNTKVSDRSGLYGIRLSGNKAIKLSDLEACGISYVPCTHQSPLFKYAHLWDVRLQVNLDSYNDVNGWTMSKMQGIQIMTGRPTHRADEHSPDGYQYLTLLDIEAQFIERYPDEFSTIEQLLKESCLSKPCIIESKSGGQHFYFFCDYLGSKTAFQDKSDEKMLVEIFSRKGLGRLDHRYRFIEGSILNPPILPKATLETIYTHLSKAADEKQHPSPDEATVVKQSQIKGKSPDEATVVKQSQIKDKEILWSDGRSQLFPQSHCQATMHQDQNHKAVQFFKWNGGVLGRCYNCGEAWYEQAPTRRHTLNPTESVTPNETWQGQQKVIEKAFDSDKETVLIRADTGVGKDYAKMTHILSTDVDAEKFIEVTARVDLADEKVDSINQRDRHKRYTMRWKNVSHGYDQHGTAPFHIRKTLIGQIMCVQPKKFETLRSRGISPQAVLCPNCPVLEMCKQVGYRSQHEKMRKADYAVTAQEGLFFDKAIAGFTKRVVSDGQRKVTAVMDEVTAHELYSENVLEKTELQRIAQWWQGTPAGNFAERMIAALEMREQPDFDEIRAIINSLNESEVRLITDAFTKIRLVGHASFTEHDKIEMNGIVLANGTFVSGKHLIVIASSKENLEILADEGIPSIFRKEIDANVLMVSYPQAVGLDIYQIPEGDEIDAENYPKLHLNPNWTPLQQLQTLFDYYPRTPDTPIDYTNSKLTFYLPPEIHESINKLIMMSATAEVKIIDEKVLPDVDIEIVDADYAKWQDGNQVFQIKNGKYPRTSVLDTDKKLNKTGNKIMDAVIAEIERTPDKKHAIITYKCVADSYKHAYPQVTFAHYGATEGENEKFADCDVFWVIFDPRIPPHGIKLMAQMIYGHDDEPLDYTYDKETGIYADERLQNIAETQATAELIQAIGRARLVRRSDVKVVIMTGRDIPGVSGRSETMLFSWNDWTKSETLDNLPQTLAENQNAEQKAVELLQNGVSQREVVRVTKLSQRQVQRVFEANVSSAAAATSIPSSKRSSVRHCDSVSISEILKGKDMSTAEILSALEVTRPTLMRKLKKLVDDGVVVKVRHGVYRLKNRGRL